MSDAALNDACAAGSDFSHLPALFKLGTRLVGEERLTEAAACFEKALRIQPDSLQVRQILGKTLVCLGNAYKAQGRIQEAVSCFRRALKVAPEEAGASNNLGAVLLEQGHSNGAVELFRRAVDLDSGFAEAYNNLALALEQQGELETAAEALERLVTVRPDLGPAWRQLGMMRFNQGDLRGATAALWRGVSIDPKMDDVDQIFLILLQAGRYLNHCSKHAAGTWIKCLRALNSESPLPDLLDYGIRSLNPHSAIRAWQRAALQIEQTQILGGYGERTLRRRDDFSKGPAKSAVLLNFGRSGSGFLHSLIDGHPQVTTMPGIYLKDFFSRGVWEAVADPDPDAMVDNFCSLYQVLFDARIAKNVPGNNHPANFPIGVSEGFSRMGENGDEALGLDMEQFQGLLRDRLNGDGFLDSGRFFVHVHAAFERTLGRQSALELLFYHIHNPNHFTFINFLRQFPGCRLLMIVRHPLQSLESWISKILDEPGAYPEIVNRVVHMLFAPDRPEFSIFPAAGVRLEDLKQDPDYTLERVCRFLGIDLAPTLKQSTMQGIQWWGDPGSIRLKKKDPFGRMPDDPTARKIGLILSEQDRLVLETLFFPFSRRFGYPCGDGTMFKHNLQRIRPLLDHPFEFERRYTEIFHQGLVPLEQNLFCAYLRRLLILRWETLMTSGTYPGLLSPV